MMGIIVAQTLDAATVGPASTFGAGPARAALCSSSVAPTGQGTVAME